MTNYGYMRVSTEDQHLDLQRRALLGRDVLEGDIYEDKASGGKRDRAGLNKLLKTVKKGDVIVVWRLDRLARSLAHLIEIVTVLEKKGAGLVSVNESIDTTTPGGRLVFHIFGALAEFERELIRERTRAGMAAARARGSQIGRPRETQTADIIHLLKQGRTKTETANELGISVMTVHRHLKEVGHG